MKIRCHCGALIIDQTDAQPNKAHLVADQDWDALLEAIDAAIERSGASTADKEAAAMQVRAQIGRTSRPVYQCRECGRLYLQDRTNLLWEFIPASGETLREIFRVRPAD